MKNRNSTQIYGIEYLRAIMSIFVVIWHMNGFGTSLIFSKQSFSKHLFTLSDFINFHILLTAVPTFILISNYLFILKEEREANGLAKRLKRLLLLLSFWPLPLLIYAYGFNGLVAMIPRSFSAFVGTILTAGHTPYYFFVSLALTIVVAHLLKGLSQAMLLLGFVLSMALLALLPIFTKSSELSSLCAYWNPLNFLPYPFIAILLFKFSNTITEKRALLINISLLLAILFSFLEWHYGTGKIFFEYHGYCIPAYTRPSLVFTTTALFIFALRAEIQLKNPIIQYIAQHSLALYCLHSYFIIPVGKLITNDLCALPAVLLWSRIVLVIVLSYIMAQILKIYLKPGLLK